MCGVNDGRGTTIRFVSEVIWRSGHEKVTSEQKIDQTGSRMAGCMRKLLLLPLHTTTQAPGRWRLHNVLATFLHVARGRSKLLACIHGASLDELKTRDLRTHSPELVGRIGANYSRSR
nr:uncharacterized protein LOC112936083 [Oryza sativa Japonica Group]